jgi:hypothetical protein
VRSLTGVSDLGYNWASPSRRQFEESTQTGWTRDVRDPRIKAMMVRFGLPAYWRAKGWPAGCRPLGDTDFECGLNSAADK